MISMFSNPLTIKVFRRISCFEGNTITIIYTSLAIMFNDVQLFMFNFVQLIMFNWLCSILFTLLCSILFNSVWLILFNSVWLILFNSVQLILFNSVPLILFNYVQLTLFNPVPLILFYSVSSIIQIFRGRLPTQNPRALKSYIHSKIFLSEAACKLWTRAIWIPECKHSLIRFWLNHMVFFRAPTFCPTGFGPKLIVQSCFRPILFSSNLLSSKTYDRPFCFCPILVQPNLTLLFGRKGSWSIIGLGQK